MTTWCVTYCVGGFTPYNAHFGTEVEARVLFEKVKDHPHVHHATLAAETVIERYGDDG
jgi:hypothetical protein